MATDNQFGPASIPPTPAPSHPTRAKAAVSGPHAQGTPARQGLPARLLRPLLDKTPNMMLAGLVTTGLAGFWAGAEWAHTSTRHSADKLAAVSPATPFETHQAGQAPDLSAENLSPENRPAVIQRQAQQADPRPQSLAGRAAPQENAAEAAPQLSALHSMGHLRHLSAPETVVSESAAPQATESDVASPAAPADSVAPQTAALPDPATAPPDLQGQAVGDSSEPSLAPPVKVKVARGDTLMKLLVKAGADGTEAHQAIAAMTEIFDPRHLRPGQEISLSFVSAEGDASHGQLHSLALHPNLTEDIQVTRDGEGTYLAKAVERDLAVEVNSAAGTIDSSLALAAQQEGVPPRLLIEAIRAFSFDVDFQREIRKGDGFEFLYETHRNSDGQLARTGPMLYGSLTLSGETVALYHYELPDGGFDYFNTEGESVRRTLMRTPIDGARLSSGFGMRKHPVLGYSKMHKGTDFAAPTGTPIYAAGNGVVEAAGRKGSYGNYIRIRHNSTFKTAYAHMHNLAKGIRRNARVQQGQIIGYVGSTGRSTGPHLHYEVHLNGKQVNPLTVKLPTGEKLTGEKLAKFQQRVAEIDRMRSGNRALMVQATCRSDATPGSASGC